MKIAFLVGQFPALSETFILNQITSLLERGHSVSIFAERRPADSGRTPGRGPFRSAPRHAIRIDCPDSRRARLALPRIIARDIASLRTLNVAPIRASCGVAEAGVVDHAVRERA